MHWYHEVIIVVAVSVSLMGFILLLIRHSERGERDDS